MIRVPRSKAYDSSNLTILTCSVSKGRDYSNCMLKRMEILDQPDSRFNERRKPFPATPRLLFRSTKQETRRSMVM